MGKHFQVVKNEIRVSKHPDGKIYFDHRVEGIFPGCRKVQKITIMPMAKGIWLRPLYGYNGTACILPIKWERLSHHASVVSDPLFPVELTESIVENAIKDAKSICFCPAVVSSDCHPNYQPEYTHIIADEYLGQ